MSFIVVRNDSHAADGNVEVRQELSVRYNELPAAAAGSPSQVWDSLVETGRTARCSRRIAATQAPASCPETLSRPSAEPSADGSRVIAGLCAGCMRSARLVRSTVALKPATILGFHRALVKRKYRLLFIPTRRGKPGPNKRANVTIR